MQREQFMRKMVTGTLTEGIAGEKAEVKDDGELMVEKEECSLEGKYL